MQRKGHLFLPKMVQHLWLLHFNIFSSFQKSIILHRIVWEESEPLTGVATPPWKTVHDEKTFTRRYSVKVKYVEFPPAPFFGGWTAKCPTHRRAIFSRFRPIFPGWSMRLIAGGWRNTTTSRVRYLRSIKMCLMLFVATGLYKAPWIRFSEVPASLKSCSDRTNTENVRPELNHRVSFFHDRKFIWSKVRFGAFLCSTCCHVHAPALGGILEKRAAPIFV